MAEAWRERSYPERMSSDGLLLELVEKLEFSSPADPRGVPAAVLLALSPVEGAADEEVGLDPGRVRVLGSLDRSYIPVSNFDVLPVVGLWDGRSPLRPNPSEVAGILRPTLRQLADPSNHGTMPLERLVGDADLRGRAPDLASPVFWVDGVVVWGFTAGLLALFLRSLGLDAPPALPRLRP